MRLGLLVVHLNVLSLENYIESNECMTVADELGSI